MTAVTEGRFYNRTQVANYLSISRMTLHRWEKIHPIPGSYRLEPNRCMTKDVIDKWKKELRKKAWKLSCYIRI